LLAIETGLYAANADNTAVTVTQAHVLRALRETSAAVGADGRAGQRVARVGKGTHRFGGVTAPSR